MTVKAAGSTTDPVDPVAVESITLNKTGLALVKGGSETLFATVFPENATDKTVTWSSGDNKVATVDSTTGKVTAVGAGATTITATTRDGDKTAICTVTVTVPAEKIYFSTDTLRIDTIGVAPDNLTVTVEPNDTTEIVGWRSDNEAVLGARAAATSDNGRRAQLTAVAPGTANVTARIKGSTGDYLEATVRVTVSGLAITPAVTSLMEMQQTSLRCDAYGVASTTPGAVFWTSSDPSVVTVLSSSTASSSCSIEALKVGTATITASKGSYTATCKVTVLEDTSSVVNMAGTYNAGQPLVLSQALSELNRISAEKTAGSYLNYITSLSVPTSQGTLYYNYNSEANTGDGVGLGDKFYPSAGSGQKPLSSLSFVPNKTFSGIAEISYSGWARNGSNFSGVIRVTVNGSGSESGISYDTISGQPADFQADDFNAYCRAKTGQNLNYVTFTLPTASTGTLYYNYASSSQYGNRVSAGTQYSRTGTTNIGNVSFVPNQGYVGVVNISFRGVNTAGTSFTGTVTINVGRSSVGTDLADVSFTAQDGKQAALRADAFNDACRGVLGENLAYVRFKLPSANEGTLYCNYSGDSSKGRVDEATRYYYSGTPGISNITFVAAANAGGQVAVPYTGYSASGATYTGTMYINLQADSQQTIRYFADKNGLVSLQVNDFNNVCLRQTGYTMDYVTFQSLPPSAMGTLYYNYRGNVNYNTRVWTGTSYYRSYDSRYSSRYLLSNITYLAGSSAGTVSIPYTVYASTPSGVGSRSASGTVVIQVGAPSPADVNLSGTTASPVWLPSYTIGGVCNAVMDKELSYIEITSVPTEKEGRVYSNYNGYGTGTEVQTGTRYYRMGSPSIDQLSFVPYGGFKGTATITYIGYSRDGIEQVSGQIKITIANSTISRYFNDMRGHTWAADAVDFLYENNISEGVGNGRYNPSGTLTRGDFTLMLVRTFGFTSDSIRRYDDVPASSYYARAISTAKALGITVGDSGSNFYPKRAITRQDAMVMLYNALKASGRTMTNGLAADLSGFSDRDGIAGYAAEAVGSLVQMGVVKGDGDGHLRPTGTLTRAETAILLQYVLTL